MRASLTVIVVGTLFVVGCDQGSSPTIAPLAPSALTAPAPSGTAQSIHPAGFLVPLTPDLAQLKLIDDLISTANLQLGLYNSRRDPVVCPDDECSTAPHDATARHFYRRANAALDAVSADLFPSTGRIV